MRIAKSILLLFLLTVTVLSGCTTQTFTPKDKEDLQGEIVALQNKISYIDKKMEEHKTEQEDFNTQLMSQYQDFFKTFNTDLSQEDFNTIKKYKELLNEPIKKGEDPLSYASQLGELDGSYTLEKAIKSKDKVLDYLTSFNKLYETVEKKLSSSDKKLVGNLDGETQTLGLTNNALTVEGALYDQNFIIKKLDMQLALKQFEDGEITKEELDKKVYAFIEEKEKYEEFITSHSFGD